VVVERGLVERRVLPGVRLQPDIADLGRVPPVRRHAVHHEPPQELALLVESQIEIAARRLSLPDDAGPVE